MRKELLEEMAQQGNSGSLGRGGEGGGLTSEELKRDLCKGEGEGRNRETRETTGNSQNEVCVCVCLCLSHTHIPQLSMEKARSSGTPGAHVLISKCH